MSYYLAVDIGASSGRHVLACLQDGCIKLEELHRFPNAAKAIDGTLCWDVGYLFDEILFGLRRCYELGKIPKSIAIDTWGVDFVLLSGNQLLGSAVSYRDHRTDDIERHVNSIISAQELYERTGIQRQPFNTINQLMALKMQQSELLESADTMLLIPDYFNFLLTGRRVTEYTNATTTQLVDVNSGDWDRTLIEKLGYPQNIFTEIVSPGTRLGAVLPNVADKIGYSCDVLISPSHDTASAVLSVPAQSQDFVYISSGTWSLVGTERLHADCSEAAMLANFTNEGGYSWSYRFLKNIMGLWMIQSVKLELSENYSFTELCKLARASKITSKVNVNDNCFLSPKSMITAIQEYCENSSQAVPHSAGELANVVYTSLADSYAKAVAELEAFTDKAYAAIHVVGGGANADYLNELTAAATGKSVYAGPVEATAIGNIASQMIHDGCFASLSEARAAILRSFSIKIYNNS